MNTYIDTAIGAVKAAEIEIMKYYAQALTVEIKADNTPVTEADRKAESIIRGFLHDKFPNHRFIGEEFGSDDLSHDDYVWIIDPIDGTKNFTRGIPFWGTLLALWYQGNVIAGVINSPATGEMLYAEKGKGTYLNGKLVEVSVTATFDEAFMSYGSLKYFRVINRQQQLLNLGERMRWSRGVGDCWSYLMLAQGKIDCMAEGYVKIWDIAPMKIIIEEAGGKVTDLSGQPLTLDSTTVLATNGLLHDRVVGAFNS